jgi:hypothetical protein
LDKRYTDEGTEIAPADLQLAAGKKVSVFTAAVATARAFTPPKSPAQATTKNTIPSQKRRYQKD